jgi:oligoendopeptidase F
MVPLSSKIARLRKRELELDELMPWDGKVDWMGDGPLKPFKDSEELAQKLAAVFHRLAPGLAPHFDKMRENKWLDLQSRPGKRGGGYCTGLSASQGSFIFMNAAGTGQDIFTLAHEAGHSFHNFESMAHQPWAQQHDYPIEFAEVASMSMELLIYPYLDEFYTPQQAARARLGHLCDIAGLFGYVAAIDAFQHYVYANPGASHAQRDAQAQRLHRRFCPELKWDGFEEEEKTVWQRKLHVFEYPFYYIDYAIAQIGALQVWAASLKDEKAAVEAYTQALQLGGTRNRPQLFEAAGAQFSFDLPLLQGLAATLEQKINESLAQLGKAPLN